MKQIFTKEAHFSATSQEFLCSVCNAKVYFRVREQPANCLYPKPN